MFAIEYCLREHVWRWLTIWINWCKKVREWNCKCSNFRIPRTCEKKSKKSQLNHEYIKNISLLFFMPFFLIVHDKYFWSELEICFSTKKNWGFENDNKNSLMYVLGSQFHSSFSHCRWSFVLCHLCVVVGISASKESC